MLSTLLISILTFLFPLFFAPLLFMHSMKQLILPKSSIQAGIHHSVQKKEKKAHIKPLPKNIVHQKIDPASKSIKKLMNQFFQEKEHKTYKKPEVTLSHAPYHFQCLFVTYTLDKLITPSDGRSFKTIASANVYCQKVMEKHKKLYEIFKQKDSMTPTHFVNLFKDIPDEELPKEIVELRDAFRPVAQNMGWFDKLRLSLKF